MRTNKERRTGLIKFRTSNHRLPIEVGRWCNIKRENRICNLCIGRNLGDEFHYLFECPSLSNERKKYFEPHFINRPNILKFCNLMNSKSVSVLCNMCKYIRIVNMRVCPPGWSTFYLPLNVIICVILLLSL